MNRSVSWQYLQRPISTLDSPTRLVGRPLIPFAIFPFERIVLEDVWFRVDDFLLLEAGEEPRERLPFVGDEFRDCETGDDGREDGLEEGRERESYSVANVAGCERLRLGVVGLERMLGDRLIGARRVEERLPLFCARLLVDVFRFMDEPERLPNLKFGFEVDRWSGLRLPARLDPRLDRRECVRPLPLELLPLIFDSLSCLSCLARRFAISWNSVGKWL